MCNYKLCDQLSEQIQELKDKKRAMMKKLASLQQKERRAKRYRDVHDKNRSLTPASTASSPDCAPRSSSESFTHLSSQMASPALILTTSPGSFHRASLSLSPAPHSPTSLLFLPKYTRHGYRSFSESVSERIVGSSKCQNL